MLRELQQTSIQGKIYLFPVPVRSDNKYLIFCATEEEAERVISAIKEKKVSHPDLKSEHFIYLTTHTDGRTKIFVPAPNLEI